MSKDRFKKTIRATLILCASSSQCFVAVAQSNALPDAPSAVVAAQSSADPTGDGSSTSTSSDKHGFVGTWVRRGLRDQADIYTAPFHRSAIKWDIGLPAATLVLIAIDKHASGTLGKGGMNVSSDISNVGLFTTVGAVGGLLLEGVKTGNPHAEEAGVLGAESMANSGLLYIVLQLITERERPLQGAGKGHFFQTSGLDNSFPSGHTIITWSAASTIAHEYPKPWVEWLAYGTATAVSVTRFSSLQHFPSDVVVGSTLGYLIGRHIFHAHCKVGLSDACSAKH